MYKKIVVFTLAAMSALNFTACGKQTDTEPVQSEEPIVARQETLTTAKAEPEITSEPETEAPETVHLGYESGVELAVITLSDKTVSVKSGDNLNDVLTDTGLQYIEWSMAMADIPVLNFYGKGYELYDTSKQADVPEDYNGTEVSFEVNDADGNRADNLEGDKSQYQIAGIRASADDEGKYDYTVTFAEGVTVGMSRTDIENTLKSTGGSENSLYIVDEKVALYIEYDYDDKAETIYSLPKALVSIPEE